MILSLLFLLRLLITKVQKYWMPFTISFGCTEKRSVHDTCAWSGILIRTGSLFVFSGIIIYHFLCLHAQLAHTVCAQYIIAPNERIAEVYEVIIRLTSPLVSF